MKVVMCNVCVCVASNVMKTNESVNGNIIQWWQYNDY